MREQPRLKPAPGRRTRWWPVWVLTALVVAGAGGLVASRVLPTTPSPAPMAVIDTHYNPAAPVVSATPGQTLTAQPVNLPDATQQVRLPDDVQAVPVGGKTWKVLPAGKPVDASTRTEITAGVQDDVLALVAGGGTAAQLAVLLDDDQRVVSAHGLTLLVTYADPAHAGTFTAWAEIVRADGGTDGRTAQNADSAAARDVVLTWLTGKGVARDAILVVDAEEQ